MMSANLRRCAASEPRAEILTLIAKPAQAEGEGTPEIAPDLANICNLT
jgi:hypothetical protein